VSREPADTIGPSHSAGPTLQLLDIGDAGPMDHPHRFRPATPGGRFTSS